MTRLLVLNMTLLTAASLAHAGTTAAQAQRDTRAWYQAYQDGRRQVQQGNWQAAIASLQAAKAAGPKPGRRVPFYGDVFDDFIPDYYLGIAYANTQRFREAVAAFDAVRASGLVTPKDREYAELVKQNELASTQLTRETIVQGPPPGQPSPVQQATVQPSPIQQSPIQQGVPPAPTPGAATANAPAGAATNAPAAANAPAPALPAQRPPAVASPVQTARAAARPTPVAKLPSSPAQGIVKRGAEADGMAAFFSGDYQRAANLLSALSVAGNTPRGELYLACSRAALALTGGADAAALAEARARFATLNVADFTADTRYISPRILDVLRSGRP